MDRKVTYNFKKGIKLEDHDNYPELFKLLIKEVKENACDIELLKETVSVNEVTLTIKVTCKI